MRTPAEAVREILARIESRAEVEAAPLAQACGRVLARDVASDVDLPPFEKSAMDGFAVRSADFAGRERPVRLRRIGEARAGAPFAGQVGAGECAEIATGSELPRGADAVVMVEKSRAEADRIALDDDPRAGQNVCHRGEDLRTGEIVLRSGRRLGPVEASVLAAVGCEPVPRPATSSSRRPRSPARGRSARATPSTSRRARGPRERASRTRASLPTTSARSSKPSAPRSTRATR